MPPPLPPSPLKGSCSVVHNNTLYVYTPEAFQSISLTENATWSQLPMEASVTGATCVKATLYGDANQTVMFLIGGSTNASTNYPGLSLYAFNNNTWTPCSPTVQVTRNRRMHGATFLNSTGVIFIYGGSQDSSLNTIPSSQTFTISTFPPYNVVSYSSKAPPAINPIILPWNASHAAMVGGRSGNKAVWGFSKEGGWADLGISLENPVGDRAQAAIINGDDGSKSLETFDLSVSPNKVTRMVLVDPNNTVPPGKLIARAKSAIAHPRFSVLSNKRRKREVTLANWPEYNSTLAPTTTRDGYSLAQDTNGQVVISGGNDDDPLSIFDPKKNSWVNATELFSGKSTAQATLSPSSTPTPSATASPTPSAPAKTSAAAAVDPTANSGRSKALTVLGATLGGVFGAAILLALLLLCIRWKRRSRREDEQTRSRRVDYPSDAEKDRLSFADRGASFMSEAGGYVRHGPNDSHTSTSSMAIMSNNMVGPGGKREPRADTYAASPLRGDVIDRGISFAPTPAGEGAVKTKTDGAGKQRSSGWSKYFSGNSGTELKHMKSNRSANTARTLSSQFQDDEARDSAKVPPLNVNGQGQVTTGSPNVTAGRGVRPPLAGQIGRSRSSSTNVSSDGQEDVFASGLRSGSHEETQWTPVPDQEFSSNRAPSSVYTASRQGSLVPMSHSRQNSYANREISTGGSLFPRNSSHGSMLGQPNNYNQAMAAQMLRESNAASSRDTNIAAFPRPGTGNGPAVTQPPEAHHHTIRAERGETAHSDMSWLNLGGNRESN